VSYNATISLVRFENKNTFIYFEKRCSLGTTTLAVHSEAVGLAPAFDVS
jgi:hypothetical protein